MDKDLITAIIAAIFGGLVTLTPVLIGSWIKFRNADHKWKMQFATMNTEHQTKLMEAKAEFKKEMDGSDNLTKLINGMLGQVSGMSEVATELRAVSGALGQNTTATNKFVETIESKFKRLDDNVDDFAARLIRATKTMEETKGEIQEAGKQITQTGQDIQKNSQNIGNTILDQIADLKKVVEETYKIVNDIDARVKRIETKPDPVPPPAIPIIPLVMKVEPQDTPAPPPASAVVDSTKPLEKAEPTPPPEEKKLEPPTNN